MGLQVIGWGTRTVVESRIIAQVVLVNLSIVPEESSLVLSLERWLINR